MNSVICNNRIAKETSERIISAGAYIVNFEKPMKEWIVWSNSVTAPCYANCRYLTRDAVTHQQITNNIVTLIRNKLINQFDIIVGLATAGLFWAATTARILEVPYAYVRSGKKTHGIGGLVEALPRPGTKAVIIDDVCASGDTFLRAIKALTNEYNIHTVAIVSILALSKWNADNHWDAFKQQGIKVYSLTDYTYLLNTAERENLLSKLQSDKLTAFYQSPHTYRWT